MANPVTKNSQYGCGLPQAMDGRDKRRFWTDGILNNALYILMAIFIIYTAIVNHNFLKIGSIIEHHLAGRCVPSVRARRCGLHRPDGHRPFRRPRRRPVRLPFLPPCCRRRTLPSRDVQPDAEHPHLGRYLHRYSWRSSPSARSSALSTASSLQSSSCIPSSSRWPRSSSSMA